MTVLRNIGQLATCAPGRPQGDAGLVDEAAVVIENGRVTYAGPEAGLPDVSPLAPVIDCGGRLVIPGLVDCHGETITKEEIETRPEKLPCILVTNKENLQAIYK